MQGIIMIPRRKFLTGVAIGVGWRIANITCWDGKATLRGVSTEK
jgi:hypothetical protein